MWRLWWPCPGLRAEIKGGSGEMGQNQLWERGLCRDDGAVVVALRLHGPSVTWHHSRCRKKPVGF